MDGTLAGVLQRKIDDELEVDEAALRPEETLVLRFLKRRLARQRRTLRQDLEDSVAALGAGAAA